VSGRQVENGAVVADSDGNFPITEFRSAAQLGNQAAFRDHRDRVQGNLGPTSAGFNSILGAGPAPRVPSPEIPICMIFSDLSRTVPFRV
jgi:hypothetical protein